MGSEIVGVVSLSTAEISDITRLKIRSPGSVYLKTIVGRQILQTISFVVKIEESLPIR